MTDHGLSKPERLCSQKLLEMLFASGHRLMVFPFSIHWLCCPNEMLPKGVPAQVLIATSKKKFHHAVDRNRVKRLMRECYRQHKPQLYACLRDHDSAMLLAVNYIHTEIFDYATLQHKFDKVTAKLCEALEEAGGAQL